MFSLKIAQEPRLRFRLKLKKNRLLGFFEKEFSEKRYFECFSYSIPYISESRPNIEVMVS